MSHSPDLIAATLKMIFSLGIVLALVWMLQRWLRRALPGANGSGGRGRWIKVLGSHHLGMKKSITLVKVPGSILVLGIGADQINLLTRIEDPAVIAGVDTVEEIKPMPGFRDQLQRIIRPLGHRAQRTPAGKPSDGAC
jgi:flagellar protein FliO/FliZ